MQSVVQFRASDFPRWTQKQVDDLNWMETVTQQLWSRLHDPQAPLSEETWLEVEKTLIKYSFYG